MTDFLTDHGVIVALVCAALAVAYGLLTTRQLLALSPGNAEMQRISGAVQEGARAYLNRQYTTIAIVGVVLFVALIFIQDIYVADRLRDRRHAVRRDRLHRHERLGARQRARGRGGPRRRLARRSTSPSAAAPITGMLVVGLALLGVAGYYGILTGASGPHPEGGRRRAHRPRLRRLADLGLRPSGRRHLHQGAPTSAPTSSARSRPASPRTTRATRPSIADNVGDNVGDCAGMAADLFETYAVTAVAVMLLGVLTFVGDDATAAALYPLVLGGVSIVASIIGTFSVRTATGNVERALYQGLIVSGVIAAIAVLPGHEVDDGRPRATGGGGDTPSVGDLYLCSLIGIGVTALLFVITDYYTSTRFGPVKKTAAASQTGHATNIIPGLAQGLQATALPALVLVLGILGSWKLAGGGTGHLRHRRRGHGAAVADRPDRRARRVRPDHRQRRRHRRDGRHARGGAQRHRPARRGRQHDQGGHQGLRDRLGRARGARAVRRLPASSSPTPGSSATDR